MSAKHDLTIPILPDRYYHIYNRGIAKQSIFFKRDNYEYFLRKYGEKIGNYVETYAYCLLDNHFHLFIKPHSPDMILAQAISEYEVVNDSFMKDYVLPWLTRIGLYHQAQEDLTNLVNLLNLLDLFKKHGDIQTNPDPHPENLKTSSFIDQLCSWILSEQLRGFMLGYAKAINKQQNRTGSLFQKGFRRKYVPDINQEKKLVLCYIHHNPIHHFYSTNYEDYQWSSYNTYFSKQPTKLSRSEALNWFENIYEFQKFSTEYKKIKKSHNWIIEEE
jgi:hypothetical protein